METFRHYAGWYMWIFFLNAVYVMLVVTWPKAVRIVLPRKNFEYDYQYEGWAMMMTTLWPLFYIKVYIEIWKYYRTNKK